jgi:two-component system chemotaxis response regulator CheB
MPEDIELEQKMSELDPAALSGDERPGEISGFTCPDCAGPLFEIREGELSRYRCRVGHAYGSAEDVLEKNRDKLEDTLYFALNKLQENAAIAGRLAARAHKGGQKNGGGALRGAGAGVEATCRDTSIGVVRFPAP